MRIIVTNENHPMELRIVERMLRKEGLTIIEHVTHTKLMCEVRTFGWYQRLQQAIEFMTTCRCEYDSKPRQDSAATARIF